jgi:hypothetical protein
MSESDTSDYSPMELREMDEQQARQELPMAQYERWEQLQALDEQADDTEQRWADESETVAGVTVHTDMEQLGTHVDAYGNDLLVYVDIERREFQQAAERLEDEFGDITVDDPDAEGAEAFGDIDPDRLDDMADHLLDMLDLVIRRWNGTNWQSLPDDQRADILATARDNWGVEGLLLAWSDIAIAIYDDREQRMEAVDSFRGAAGRGDN